MIPLSKLQKEIMEEFYNIPPTKVVYNKKERMGIWNLASRKQGISNFDEIEKRCPALAHQIKKSYDSGNNIQSAVFSECVYAQTYANMLNLNCFENFIDNGCTLLSVGIEKLLNSYNLFPRYGYYDEGQNRMLIQAGGCNGIDSALITVWDLNIYTIEFKEQGAKTSEPDLPKYKEDGKLVINNSFLKKYPQFKNMLEEHKDLNFFEVMGSNVHNFNPDSVNIAVSNNYTKKYADVICTEDVDGYLVMIPANQVSKWATIEGEIRPAGRNSYKVWTPIALRRFLDDLGADIKCGEVKVRLDKLQIRKQRGGNGSISGYKINPLFFVRSKDCILDGIFVIFDIKKVKQLNPTIAGKMFFEKTKHRDICKYYFGR